MFFGTISERVGRWLQIIRVHVPRIIRWSLLAVLILILGLWLATALLSHALVLPAEFKTVQSEAALVSRQIVTFTNLTYSRIERANSLDYSGDAAEARTLIDEARTSNGEASQLAFLLSRHLRKMTESLDKVDSAESKIRAYEAIAVELGLISEFINYTETLNNFLSNLERAVASDDFRDRKMVADSLKKVNEKVESINSLNGEFLERISVFD